MRLRLFLALAAAPLVLAACAGGGDGDSAPVAPPPPPPQAAATYNVTPCLNQVVSNGRTLANLVVPDTVKLNLTQPSQFPNGRRLTDSVIDLTLAYLFIDTGRHGVDVLTRLPLGPQGNDVPFRAEFPYLAVANGTPPPAGTGSNFNFRTDPPSAYVQVDRMGMPAVATAVIGTSAKTPYNDDSPAVDGTLKFVPEIGATLTTLTNALADDFIRAGLTPCATPVT